MMAEMTDSTNIAKVSSLRHITPVFILALPLGIRLHANSVVIWIYSKIHSSQTCPCSDLIPLAWSDYWRITCATCRRISQSVWRKYVS